MIIKKNIEGITVFKIAHLGKYIVRYMKGKFNFFGDVLVEPKRDL